MIRVTNGRPDGVVVGVVIGRHNSADGWVQNMCGCANGTCEASS